MQDLKTGAYVEYDDKATSRAQDAKQHPIASNETSKAVRTSRDENLLGSTRVDQEKIDDTTFVYKAPQFCLSDYSSHGMFKAKVTDGTDQQLTVLSRRAEQEKPAVIDETRSGIHFRNSRISIEFRETLGKGTRI
ncbi:hypothetical protein BTUL_0004g00730 [Botrytis tulipae]|uniref:Uncharacterized protein n=1 Tax=Botrytis tulipae TaxID=87230 RepID=A0A4Z1FCZ5_9HELO|nr:hypothetical protein BTUL_0004g00730 [Botrytis tulipae]